MTKVLSDSPGLVEWLVGLAFSYRSLPDGQAPLVLFSDDKFNFGLAPQTFGLVISSNCLPEGRPHLFIFVSPCSIRWTSLGPKFAAVITTWANKRQGMFQGMFPWLQQTFVGEEDCVTSPNNVCIGSLLLCNWCSGNRSKILPSGKVRVGEPISLLWDDPD